MSDARPYAVCTSQDQGHEPFRIGNPSIFQSYLLHHLEWELTTDF